MLIYKWDGCVTRKVLPPRLLFLLTKPLRRAFFVLFRDDEVDITGKTGRDFKRRSGRDLKEWRDLGDRNKSRGSSVFPRSGRAGGGEKTFF